VRRVGVMARMPGQPQGQRRQLERHLEGTSPTLTARDTLQELISPTRSVSRMAKSEEGKVPTLPTTRR
jgi:hypothetical protein